MAMRIAVFGFLLAHHAAALVAGPHSPARSLHPAQLALRGGGRGKKEEAPAAPLPALKPPGRIASMFNKTVKDVFDAVDTNKDGKVDRRPRRHARACLSRCAG